MEIPIPKETNEIDIFDLGYDRNFYKTEIANTSNSLMYNSLADAIDPTLLNWGQLIIGQDSEVFKVSNSGINLGDQVFADSPFKVSMAGILTATGATVNNTVLALLPFYGDGSDGDVDINSGAFSSGPITSNALTRDVFFDDLTLSGGNLNCAGYRLFCTGTLTINTGYKIHRNGNAGTAGTNASGVTPGDGGAGGTALGSGTIYGSEDGKIGGNGAKDGDAVGGQVGTNGDNLSSSLGGNGQNGGAGGTSTLGGGTAKSGGSGGSGGTATAASSRSRSSIFGLLYDITDGAYPTQLKGSAGVGSGGGGGAGTNGTAGGGGGSGTPGGLLWIGGKILVLNGTIEAKGGNGGNGGNGSGSGASYSGCGGGGGAGGNGGIIQLIYNSKSGTGSISVAGGTKGTGGTKAEAGSGIGTAQNGVDGTDGSIGILMELQQ